MPADLATWKLFLKARIDQERGEHDVALSNIREALKRDPDNPFFHRAQAHSLKALGMPSPPDEALRSIDRKYSEIAARNTGEGDLPEVWIAELRQLLQEVEQEELRAVRKIDWRTSVSNVW